MISAPNLILSIFSSDTSRFVSSFCLQSQHSLFPAVLLPSLMSLYQPDTSLPSQLFISSCFYRLENQISEQTNRVMKMLLYSRRDIVSLFICLFVTLITQHRCSLKLQALCDLHDALLQHSLLLFSPQISR